jgi:hypothetical protein
MIEVISIGVPLVHGQYKEWALLPGMFEADSAKLWAMMFRLRGRAASHVAICGEVEEAYDATDQPCEVCGA